MNNSRRDFIKKATTGAAILAAPAILGSAKVSGQVRTADAVAPFKLKYAPGLGMFQQHAGQDPVDNIKFIHDQGFRAVFDNNLMRREPAVQEKIMTTNRPGMDIGPYVLRADRKQVLLNSQGSRYAIPVEEGVEVSKGQGQTALIVLGRYDMRLLWLSDSQCIDNLRYLRDIMEPAGLPLVLSL